MKIHATEVWMSLAVALAVATAASIFNLPHFFGSAGIVILLFLVTLFAAHMLFAAIIRRKTESTSPEDYRHHRDLEALIDSFPDIIYRLDEKGIITFINNAVTRYGYDPDELIGRKITVLVHDDDKAYGDQWLRERRTGVRSTRHAEIRLLTAPDSDGRQREHICLVDAWGIYVPDGNGGLKYMGSRGVGRDISDLKRIERDLEQSQRMLRAVLDTVPQRIFWKDREGRFLGANRQFAADYGFTHPSELIGRTDLDVVPDKKEAGFFMDVDKEVIETGRAVSNIIEPLLTADGTHRWLHTNKVPLHDSVGRIIGVLGTYEDITERIEAEEEQSRRRAQMIQADKMISLGVLVAGMAHEVNNPNNFIMMNAPILQRVWDSCKPLLERYYEENGEFMLANVPYSRMRSEVPELFEGIHAGSRRIESIVSSLLTYSRKDSNVPQEVLDVNEILQDAVSLVSNLLRKSTDYFSQDYSTVLPRIKGNHQRIEQVLVNLLQNACQALTDRSQEIKAGTYYDSVRGMVVVRIIDKGRGIAPGDRRRIREPFFTTRRDSGGTGLGLSISDGIMKDHGGWLEFDSTPDKGTTVYAYFPATSVNSNFGMGVAATESGKINGDQEN